LPGPFAQLSRRDGLLARHVRFAPNAYRSLAAWLTAATGLVCIELIVLGSARRLEMKQAERYGSDPAYQDYARRVPILIPLLPLYSLSKLKNYLG